MTPLQVAEAARKPDVVKILRGGGTISAIVRVLWKWEDAMRMAAAFVSYLMAIGIGGFGGTPQQTGALGAGNEPLFRVKGGAAITLIGFVTAKPRLVALTPSSVAVWDLEGRRLISDRPFGGSRLYRALTPDGRLLAAGFMTIASSGARTYDTLLLDVESGRTTMLTPPANDDSGVLVISSDGTKLVRATWENPLSRVTVQVWQLPAGGLLSSATIEPVGSSSGHMALSSDGKRLAIATHGKYPGNPYLLGSVGRILIFDTTTKRLVTSFPTSDIPRAMAFSSDGAELFVGSDADSAVHVFDPQSGLEVTAFGDPGGSVNPGRGVRGTIGLMTLAAGSGRLVTGSHNADLRVWDTARRQLLRTITLDSQPFSLAIGPGGRQIAAGTQNGSVYVLDIDGPGRPPGY